MHREPESAQDAIPVVPVARVEIALAPQDWPFAQTRRAEIDAYFARAQAAKPALWNGRVLLLHRFGLAEGGFRGACLETDFASFLAWRDWGFPDPSVRNGFGMAAVRSVDGAFLLGVMGPATANAGKAYFPAGMLEPADLAGQTVDLESSIRRELKEETGLDADACEAAPGWHAVFAGARISLVKVLQTRLSAAELAARVAAHIAADPDPELAGVRLVRGPRDLDAAVPDHVAAFLNYTWGNR